MIYSFEPVYLHGEQSISPERCVSVTAQAVAPWVTYYCVHILLPRKETKERVRFGALPADLEKRKRFIADLLIWIEASSSLAGEYALFLDTEPYSGEGERICLFDHHDDACCWSLNISSQQFAHLQTVWKEAHLPEDLFYETSRQVCVVTKLGIVRRLLSSFGLAFENEQRYSPREWEEKQKREKLDV